MNNIRVFAIIAVLCIILIISIFGSLDVLSEDSFITGQSTLSPIFSNSENYNECKIQKSLSGEMYNKLLLTEGNFFRKSKKEGMSGYQVRVNSQGFRDENFNFSNPKDKRIMVLGDSFTYGVGLNRSERFTELLEQKMEDTQVINAGIPGAGIKDYYQLLYSKGVDYNPDTVIVLLTPGDIFSRRTNDLARKETMSSMDVDSLEELSGKEFKNFRRKMREKIRRKKNDLSWRSSPIRLYGNGMNMLASQRNFSLYLVHLKKSKRDQITGQGEIGRHWKKNCEINLTFPFKEIQENKYYFPDYHLNAAGNKVMAEKLYQLLNNQTNS